MFLGVIICLSCSCSLLYGSDIQYNDQYLKNKLKYQSGRYIEKNLIILIHPPPLSTISNNWYQSRFFRRSLIAWRKIFYHEQLREGSINQATDFWWEKLLLLEGKSYCLSSISWYRSLGYHRYRVYFSMRNSYKSGWEEEIWNKCKGGQYSIRMPISIRIFQGNGV